MKVLIACEETQRVCTDEIRKWRGERMAYIDKDEALKKVSWDTEAYMTIKMISSVDVPEKNVGEWIFYERRDPQYDLAGTKTWANTYRCSECGFLHTVIEDFGHYLYCPSCGAYMGKETEDE